MHCFGAQVIAMKWTPILIMVITSIALLGAGLVIRDDYISIFNSEGSASESEDDNERNDVAEEETDEDDNVFFDACDILSSRVSSFSSDNDAFEYVDSSNRNCQTL
ncbi:hypothetical protein MtrunA17_Chr4g0064431 [Medicago truncatula]|uniref:Transmembrane protein n=1 Tax=Medicago truncatula TaxID=3880 RepID=A0A396IGQ1_MEDTR|nr:hypothetical protein MtrunA17_Chr4g0064431 [Medicago truncatula]